MSDLAGSRKIWQPPGGDLTWWSIILFLGGVYLAIPLQDHAHIWRYASAIACLLSAGAVWVNRPWSIMATFGVLASAIMVTIISMMVTGASFNHFAMIALIAWSAFALWTMTFGQLGTNRPSTGEQGEPEDDLVSLVAFLPEPLFLDNTVLAHLAGRCWDVHMGTEEDESVESFVVGESPHFLVKYEDCFFTVHNVDVPYFEEPAEIAEHMNELRIRHAIEDHQAWVSVDLIRGDESATDEQAAYRLIARLLLELIDDDCMAICCPGTGQIYPYHESLQRELQKGDPFDTLRELFFPPVLGIEADDPRMQKAVQEARERWPDFMSAFEKRDGDQHFSIKAPVTDGHNTEYIWVNVSAIENDIIYGTLGNDPVNLRGYRLDDRIRVPLHDLNDWMYIIDDQIHGGFTLEVFKQISRPQPEDDT